MLSVGFSALRRAAARVLLLARARQPPATPRDPTRAAPAAMPAPGTVGRLAVEHPDTDVRTGCLDGSGSRRADLHNRSRPVPCRRLSGRRVRPAHRSLAVKEEQRQMVRKHAFSVLFVAVAVLVA